MVLQELLEPMVLRVQMEPLALMELQGLLVLLGKTGPRVPVEQMELQELMVPRVQMDLAAHPEQTELLVLMELQAHPEQMALRGQAVLPELAALTEPLELQA